MENATIIHFYFDFENGPNIMPELFSLKALAHMRTLNSLSSFFFLMSLSFWGRGRNEIGEAVVFMRVRWEHLARALGLVGLGYEL